VASVFITDLDNRKALVAARNLGKHGITVIGGSDDPTAIGRFSRYCRWFVRYPSPRTRPDEYQAFIDRFLRDHPVDVFMPMDDETVLLAAARREELSRLTAVPVPPLRIVRRARDKGETLAWARQARVHVPDTWLPGSAAEAGAIAREVRYPIIIKPRESSGSRGILRVDRPEDLVPAYQRVHARYERPLIQEYVPRGGGKYHVAVLMDDHGRVVAQFTHRIIREWPVHGGVGTLGGCDHPAAAGAQAVRLLKTMGWGPGVTMNEFLIDPRTGHAVLMEVNPRFWGTLQSAISAGVEFPYLLFRLARGEQVTPVTEYPMGVACQWELPGDLLNFLFNPERWRADPPYIPRRGSPRTFTILSPDDPVPALGFAVGVAYHLFDRPKWKHVFRRL
jgi:predicted ATP-grasp superfamily ATP-dependent carboligase